MRLAVEHLLKQKQPVCIIDPKGDWWGLKLAKDGRRPGYPVVVFGGDHADVPITPHAGAHIAELFATGNRPCLVDLGGWTVADRTRFWIEFASTLFRLTKGQRWLVIDEVHNFAPKGKIFDAEAGKALHWSNRLASEGLGKGLSMLVASQRPQKVHNDLLTSAETLIAMRVLHLSDRGAVSDWIKGCGDADGGQVLSSLAPMARGEAWVWSPEIGFGPERVKFPLFHTYDSFRPQSMEDAKHLTGWAEVDLDEIRTKMATIVQQAQADDPRELRRQVAERDKRIVQLERSVVGPVPPQVQIQKESVLTDADRAVFERFSEGIVNLRRFLERGHEAVLAGAMQQIRDVVTDVSAASLGSFEQMRREFDQRISQSDVVNVIQKLQGLHQYESARSHDQTRLSPRHQTARVSVPTLSPGVPLKAMHRAMLTALAQHPDGLTKRQILIHTGYASSGPVSTAFADLARSGWTIGNSRGLVITNDGLVALGTFDPLPLERP